MAVLINPKHERFAQELAQGVSASEAYVRAGYSKNDGNAIRLKGNDKVRERVAEIVSAAAEKVGVTVERIVTELAKIGFGDIRRAISWGESIALDDGDGGTRIASGVALMASKDIEDDAAAAIAEIAQTKDGLRIKFHDKRAALVDLGRHLGMFKDNVEHSGKVTLSHEDALSDLE